MAISIITNSHRQAKKLLLIQLLVIIALSTVLSLVKLDCGIASLSGGLAVLLPTMVFVKMAFMKSGATASKQVLRAMYLGEAVKFLLSAGLLVVAFVLLQRNEIFVLTGFVVALLSQWLTPLVVKMR